MKTFILRVLTVIAFSHATTLFFAPDIILESLGGADKLLEQRKQAYQRGLESCVK